VTKAHGGRAPRGPDVEVHGAPVRLIILLDGKIEGERRPKIGRSKAALCAADTRRGIEVSENHPNGVIGEMAGVSVDGFGDEIPDMLYVDFGGRQHWELRFPDLRTCWSGLRCRIPELATQRKFSTSIKSLLT